MAAANIHEKYFKINTLLSSHPLKTSKVYCVKVIYVTKPLNIFSLKSTPPKVKCK